MRIGRYSPWVVSLRLAAFLGVLIAIGLPAAPARAQASGGGTARGFTEKLAIKGALGFSTFIDEDFIEHLVAGGSVRIPLTDKTALEPEFLYMRADPRDDDFYLLANLTRDIASHGPLTWYLVGGFGVVWHREKGLGHDGTLTYVSREPHAAGGMGMRWRAADRWVLSSEVRFGLEPFFQATGSLGYVF